jgi:hypothetical protein
MRSSIAMVLASNIAPAASPLERVAECASGNAPSTTEPDAL